MCSKVGNLIPLRFFTDYPPESEANIKVANYIVRFLGLGYQKIKINVGEDSGKYGTFLVNVP